VAPRVCLLVTVTGLFLLALSGCVGPSGGIRSIEDESGGLEEHAPIWITGDADLRDPAAGVRSGNGTPLDPYVISAWFIDLAHHAGGRLGAAITISDTGMHIVLRDCRLKKTPGASAIHIQRAKHVRIERCAVLSGPPSRETPSPSLTFVPTNSTAFPNASVEASSSAAAQESPVTTTVLPSGQDGPPAPAILVEDADDVDLANNTVSDGPGDGIAVTGSSDVTVVANDVTGTHGNGINLTASSDVVVANNTLTDNQGDGVHAEELQASVVANNSASGNGGYGVAVQGNDTQVVLNAVSGNGGGGGGGILVQGSGVTVSSNTAQDNSHYGIVVMPDARTVRVESNTAQGEDGGDRIIVPDPQDPGVTANSGRVEPVPPNFDPRPGPTSHGLDEKAVVIAIVGLLMGGGALAWIWWRRGFRIGGV
jgi:parallel beta-helix repeat protein